LKIIKATLIKSYDFEALTTRTNEWILETTPL
jgi:hypothetical protein